MKATLFTNLILFSALSLTAQSDTISVSENESFLNEIVIQQDRIQIPFSKQNRNIPVINRAIIKTLPVSSVNELLT